MNGQKPFEGDTYIRAELEALRDKFGLTTCVETGTQFGATTQSFCEMFKSVVSIEADQDFLWVAKERLRDIQNVVLLNALSQDVLEEVTASNTLYYLDAHGCAVGGCPLKQELQILADANLSNIVIAIHDFRVPEKDFGFDEYDFPLSIEEIEPLLHKVFKSPKWHYNTEANGAYRGIIYIYEG
jgi:hypothetical protein